MRINEKESGDMNEIYSFIESSLDYSLYLAENDFIRQLAIIDNRSKYVTESKYIVLNEALLDTIRQYLTKVVRSLSAAFEKFKKTMAEEKDIQDTLNLINKNRNLLTSDFKMLLPDNFEVPDIEKWKNIFNNITSDFKAFDTTNYNSWKTANALESPEAYIKHNFNALASLMNQDGNMVENMHTAVYGNTKNNKNVAVDSGTVADFAEFIEGYRDNVDTIAKQIDSINTSNRNIDQYLSSITAAKESYLGLDKVLSILYEEENGETSTNTQTTTQNTPPAPNVDNNTKFRDADNPNGEQNNNNKNEGSKDRQYIVNFVKANTTVLSAEMKLCNQIRRSSQQIVKNFINLQLKKNGEAASKVAQAQTQNTNTNNGPVPTVNTR